MKDLITVGNIRKVLVIVQDCMEMANLDIPAFSGSHLGMGLGPTPLVIKT